MHGGYADLDQGETRRLLRIVSQTGTVTRHLQLFQMMQGDVQYFLPHQILITAWGDLRGSELKFDVASASPGMRTDQLDGSNVGELLRELYARWLDGSRKPLLLETSGIRRLAQQNSGCALRKFLHGMQALLVHGVHSARDGTDTLYLTANTSPMAHAGNQERFHRIADLIIAQIDVAYRRVTGLQIPAAKARFGVQAGTGSLTPREQEILAWIARGRPNADIAQVLGISTFTVKNHVQRIIRKLGATNRTEAAAIFRFGNLRQGELHGKPGALAVSHAGIAGAESRTQP